MILCSGNILGDKIFVNLATLLSEEIFVTFECYTARLASNDLNPRHVTYSLGISHKSHTTGTHYYVYKN